MWFPFKGKHEISYTKLLMLLALFTIRIRQSNDICIIQGNKLVSPCYLCMCVRFFPSLPVYFRNEIKYSRKHLVKRCLQSVYLGPKIPKLASYMAKKPLLYPLLEYINKHIREYYKFILFFLSLRMQSK